MSDMHIQGSPALSSHSTIDAQGHPMAQADSRTRAARFGVDEDLLQQLLEHLIDQPDKVVTDPTAQALLAQLGGQQMLSVLTALVGTATKLGADELTQAIQKIQYEV